MMEAVRISETSVYSNKTTRCYVIDGSNLHIRCHENLKSQAQVSFKYQSVQLFDVFTVTYNQYKWIECKLLRY
jgi:hypothetical protein